MNFIKHLSVPVVSSSQLDFKTPIDMVLDCTGTFAQLEHLKLDLLIQFIKSEEQFLNWDYKDNTSINWGP